MKTVYLSTFLALGVLAVNSQISSAASLQVVPNSANIAPGSSKSFNMIVTHANETINCDPCTFSVSIPTLIATPRPPLMNVSFVNGPSEFEPAFTIFVPAVIKIGETFTGTASFTYNPTISADFTVTVVPEPFTILGAGVALGFGTLFKRKLNHSKSSKKEAIKLG